MRTNFDDTNGTPNHAPSSFWSLRTYRDNMSVILRVVLLPILFVTISPTRATASSITITFEGLCDNTMIGAYYAGGFAGTCSGLGPNYGVLFVGAVAKIQSDLGGSGVFSSEPSPPTAAFGQSIITIDVPIGFASGIAFFYSNPYSSTTVRIFDQGGLRGNTLAEENLPATPQVSPGVFGPFVSSALSFNGIARSLGITTRGPNGLYLDDLVFTPQAASVPEPGGFGLTFATLIFFAGAGLLRANVAD